MNGYYALLIEILKRHDYVYARNGKGSHEVWIKIGPDGLICGRVLVPVHLNSKNFANHILKEACLKERV